MTLDLFVYVLKHDISDRCIIPSLYATAYGLQCIGIFYEQMPLPTCGILHATTAGGQFSHHARERRGK